MVYMRSNRQTWTSSTGSVSRMEYGNNDAMSGIIVSADRTAVKLQFCYFDTEPGYDLVTVSSCEAINCSQSSVLGVYSGSTIPDPVTSSTGIMLIRWTSDGSQTRHGWSAEWSSSADAGVSPIRPEPKGGGSSCAGLSPSESLTRSWLNGSGTFLHYGSEGQRHQRQTCT